MTDPLLPDEAVEAGARALPASVGLCPDHRDEWHMPDAKDGESCPELGCSEKLAIYLPERAVREQVARELRAPLGCGGYADNNAADFVTRAADFIEKQSDAS